MNIFYAALMYMVWFLATYYIVFFTLMLLLYEEKLYEKKTMKKGKQPLVSLIVPAYFEEGKIGMTIESLKKLTYKNYEVIIVNDGSTDGTAKEVRASIGKDKRFRFLDNKVNKGKAAALNDGIAIAKGKFIGCMDADSCVEPGILEKSLPYFEENDVGAVTVTVEVKETKTLLHKIIDLEYIIGLSLFLKVFSLFDCVFVTPGPFSIYRKKVLDEIGGFDADNITEDLEIAYRIHKAKYKIKNCLEAKVYTIIPPTFKEIYVQRRRWYSGAVQTLFQHKDVVFKKKYGAFGYFIPFNYMLIGLGLILFFVSTGLSLSNFVENMWYFQYTNFNFLERLFDYEFDILAMGKLSFVGYTSFMAGIMIMLYGLKLARKKYANKRWGMLGYPLLFFLYQIFWIGAIVAVLRGKKVKWR